MSTFRTLPVADGRSLDPGMSVRLNAGVNIVTWRVRLRAGEQCALELRYSVDVPSSYE